MLNDKSILRRGVSYILINLGNAFKNGACKICGWHPWKNVKWFGLFKQTIICSNFLKAAFHKFNTVNS